MILYRITTHRTTAMRVSSPARHRQPTSSGDACRSCRSRSAKTAACSTVRQKSFPASPHTARAISTRRQRISSRSSACRPTNRSSVPSCRTAASRWRRKQQRATATKSIRNTIRFSTNTIRHITRPCSMPTPMRCAVRVTATSSRDCRIPTAAAVSSATTAAWPSTASTI